MGGRSSSQLDELARAVADGVPRRVVVGRIAAFMAAMLVGDPELALGAKKRCPKGRKHCGDRCCKPGYVCKRKHHKHQCVCPKPRKVCNGRCCASGEHCVNGRCKPAQQQQQPQPEPQPQPTPTPEPTCTDGVQNGNETDVDCGGPTCPKCADGKRCATATDCASGVCTGGVCVEPPPVCSADVCGQQHGCPACANGKTCASGTDCASGHCSGGVCVQCESAANCTPAASGSCQQAVCASGVCGFAADDTNTPTPASDCMQGTCSGGTPGSTPQPPDHECSTGVCDGSGNCVGCVSGNDCGTSTECVTYTCTAGICGASFTPYGTPTSAGPSCSGSTLSTPICDGNGGTTQSTTSCSPYNCSNNTCQTSCSNPTDCDASHTCIDGNCVAKCTSNSQCAVANGTGVCNQGTCQIATCNPGYGNCDGKYFTGCETNVYSSVQNCGACGQVCAPANATGVCVSGNCAIQSCNPGFFDCDGNPANGCEYSGAICPP